MDGRLLPQLFALKKHFLYDLLQLFSLALPLQGLLSLQDLFETDLAAEFADVAQRGAHGELADLFDEFVHPCWDVFSLLLVLSQETGTLLESPRLSRER